jgi:Excalibur calcium-binding domain
MLIVAMLIAVTPLSGELIAVPSFQNEMNVTKKKKRSGASGGARRFSSCAAARKAGYTHMRRGKPGYSTNLDRDGDGVACDKVG